MMATLPRSEELHFTLAEYDQRCRAEYVAEMKKVKAATWLHLGTIEHHRNRLMTRIKTQLETTRKLREMFGIANYPEIEPR